MNTFFRMMKLNFVYPKAFAWFAFTNIIYAVLANIPIALAKLYTEVLDFSKELPHYLNQSLLKALKYGPLDTRLESFRLWLCGGETDVNRMRIFTILLIASFFIVALKSYFMFLKRYAQAWITQRILLGVQNKLSAHLLVLDMSFYHAKRQGDVMSRLTNDLGLLHSCTKLLCTIITQPIALLIGVGYIFYLDWQLAIVGFIAAPVAGLIIQFLTRKLRKASRKAQEKRADLTSRMVQFLSGIRIVKAFGCEEFEKNVFSKENENYFKISMQREKTKSRVRPTVEFVSVAFSLIVFWIGGKHVIDGTMTLPNLMAFFTALVLMYQPGKDLSEANADIKEALPAVERVFEFLDINPTIINGTVDKHTFSSTLTVDNVSYAYVKDTPVLQNIQLTIHRGERVAIVGPSGAGKSTLVDLLLRFYDPDEGAVLLDGIDYKSFTLKCLREQFAIVSQEAFLFNGTIHENIAYGCSLADKEQTEHAARAANVHEDIVSFPDGYDTIVGERGANVSGGQRQRITIARALFRNAPILILDEATSSLDSENERKVQKAFDYLMKGRTSIVIAHRLSTVKQADRIVVLEDGRITAIGTHDELLIKSRTYANFVELQSMQPEQT